MCVRVCILLLESYIHQENRGDKYIYVYLIVHVYMYIHLCIYIYTCIYISALRETAICEHACPCSQSSENRVLRACFPDGLSELATLLDKAHRSLEFYRKQLRSTSDHADDEENECSICLGNLSDAGTCAILPCSHVFHSDCIRAVLAASPLCPECRAPAAAVAAAAAGATLSNSERS